MKILTIILIPLSVFALGSLHWVWFKQANNEPFLELAVFVSMMISYLILMGFIREAIKSLKKEDENFN